MNESTDPYDHLSLAGYENVMLCIGNHDAYPQNHHGFTDVISEEDCYVKYLKDNIANWNVNYTVNKNFYYKDYHNSIRLIVLDSMHWNQAQKEWLEDVLYGENNSDSAIALGLHVIISQHVPVSGTINPPIVYIEGMDFIDCTFVSKDDLSIGHTYNYDSLEIVDAFQQAGGTFITWLFGHWHVDAVGKYKNYPNQMFIVQACGIKTGTGGWADTERIQGTTSENQFSIYSFDPEKKYIRILRAGAEFDRNLQHKCALTLSYEYGNIKIITNN